MAERLDDGVELEHGPSDWLDKWITGQKTSLPDGTHDPSGQLGLPSGRSIIVRDGVVVSETRIAPSGSVEELESWSVHQARINRGWDTPDTDSVVVLGTE